MNRRTAIRRLATFFLTTASLAEAQQQAKILKIGLLRTRLAASGTSLEGLLQELRALGYVEGKNVVFESRSAEGKVERLPALVDELIRLKVDVIVAAATNEARIAKSATKSIPIVCLSMAEPVVDGLVDSLARPGGNVTGFSSFATVLAGKRLELLKETLPNLTRVAVLWNPQEASGPQQWKESQLPARELGLQLHSMEVGSADKYERAFKEAAKARSAALAVTQGSFNNSYQKQIVDLVAKNRLPAIYPRGDFVENGGLMSYGADRNEPYKRVAVMVDKILKGTKLADIPVEQPMRFEFIVNLIAAKQIGVTIPPNVLVRAQRVIR